MLANEFAQRISDVHGAAGAEWLGRLPDIVAQCEWRWSLKAMPPFAPVSYVALAIRADGMEVVLQLGVPHQGLTAEIEALRLFDGRGGRQAAGRRP